MFVDPFAVHGIGFRSTTAVAASATTAVLGHWVSV